MRPIDYITTALRNIGRQKLRSALTIFAIVIGATSVTIMLALVTGAKDFFYKQFESSGQLQQVAVTPQTDLDYRQAQTNGNNNCADCTKLTDALAAQIQTIPHVHGLSRTAYVYVFDHLTFGSKNLRVEQAQAYEPNGIITHDIAAGRDLDSSDAIGSVVITQEYADKMGYKGNYAALVGKHLTFTTTTYFTGEGATLPDPLIQWRKCNNGGCDSSDGPPAQSPTTLPATIVGIVSEQNPAIYVPLSWAAGLLENRHYDMTKTDQEAFNQANATWNQNGRKGTQPVPHFTLVVDNPFAKNGYPGFTVGVDQTSNTETVATAIRKFNVGAVTAQSFIKTQLSVFKIISFVLGGIGGIALLVAAIGVINTMIMSILERTREIGVMRAVGAKRVTVSFLFTIEAALLGFWGGIFGVLAGYGLTRLSNVLINKQLAENGVNAHNIIGLPVWLVVSVVVITTIIGLLAGLYPARRAAKLDPVEALRYE